jgi:hypothetical protein
VDELVQHLEVVRFGGRVGFASLALLTPRGESKECRAARLEAIMRWHEEAGIHIFNPHTHVLEDGGQGWIPLFATRYFAVTKHGSLDVMTAGVVHVTNLTHPPGVSATLAVG